MNNVLKNIQTWCQPGLPWLLSEAWRGELHTQQLPEEARGGAGSAEPRLQMESVGDLYIWFLDCNPRVHDLPYQAAPLGNR